MQPDSKLKADANRDPITGAAGSHPVGTGVGAIVGGAIAGAATGTVAGPVGTAIGAAVGALAGGLAGKTIAEQIDPTAEEAYWRDEYMNRPYSEDGVPFDSYAPAYRYGAESYARYPDRSYDDIEPTLGAGWDAARGTSTLEWDRARHATRDAWHRVSDTIERATPGDSDRDGK